MAVFYQQLCLYHFVLVIGHYLRSHLHCYTTDYIFCFSVPTDSPVLVPSC